MKAGVVLPQGWVLEYRDHDPREAWANTVAVAQAAERLGFESLWLYDHFHTWPEPEDAIVFEPFVALAAAAVSAGSGGGAAREGGPARVVAGCLLSAREAPAAASGHQPAAPRKPPLDPME